MRIFVVALAGVLIASAVGAQSTQVSSTSNGSIAAPGSTCGGNDSNTGPQGASSFVTCTYGGATVTAVASGGHGDLHIDASASGVLSGANGYSENASAGVFQSFQDVMHISGVAPSFFRFFIQTNGLMGTAAGVYQLAGSTVYTQ